MLVAHLGMQTFQAHMYMYNQGLIERVYNQARLILRFGMITYMICINQNTMFEDNSLYIENNVMKLWNNITSPLLSIMYMSLTGAPKCMIRNKCTCRKFILENEHKCHRIGTGNMPAGV